MPVGYLGKAGIVLFIATLFVPVLSCDLLLGSGNASDVEDEDDGSGGDSGGEDCVWSGLGYMVFSEMGKDDDVAVWITQSRPDLPSYTHTREIDGAAGKFVFFELSTKLSNSDIEEGEYLYPDDPDNDQSNELINITVVRGMVDVDNLEYVASTLSLSDLGLSEDLDDKHADIEQGSVDVSKAEDQYMFVWSYEYVEDEGDSDGSYTGTYIGPVDDTKESGPRSD